MNYFDIFNKVLLELNYRPLQDFGQIYKSEHQKILNNINRVNSEVLGSFDWSFLHKYDVLELLAGENSMEMPFSGTIKQIYENNTKLSFNPRYEDFFNGNAGVNTYGYYNNKIMFPKSDKTRRFEVYYTSKNYAMDALCAEIAELKDKDDCSVLPMPYAELILVYGTCLKVKANPSYPKFGFWNTMLVQVLGNLKSKCSPTFEDEPCLKIGGQKPAV